MEQLACPEGHHGPWRYVEAIEVWRDVIDDEPEGLTIASEWHTGNGFAEGIPGTAYLLCWASLDNGGHCVERIDLPDGIDITWA